MSTVGVSMAGVTVEPTLDGWWFGVRDADGEVRESRGERRIVRAGETLRYDGTPEVCRSGMHCSPNPLVALGRRRAARLWCTA